RPKASGGWGVSSAPAHKTARYTRKPKRRNSPLPQRFKGTGDIARASGVTLAARPSSGQVASAKAASRRRMGQLYLHDTDVAREKPRFAVRQVEAPQSVEIVVKPLGRNRRPLLLEGAAPGRKRAGIVVPECELVAHHQ